MGVQHIIDRARERHGLVLTIDDINTIRHRIILVQTGKADPRAKGAEAWKSGEGSPGQLWKAEAWRVFFNGVYLRIVWSPERRNVVTVLPPSEVIQGNFKMTQAVRIVEVPKCPYDGMPIKLVSSTVIYNGQDYGWAWVCGNWPACDAYVGCHPGTKQAMGTVANKATRKARQEAHAAFDALWHAKMAKEKVSRREARSKGYLWLAAQLKLAPGACHISQFYEADCARVVTECAPFIRKTK